MLYIGVFLLLLNLFGFAAMGYDKWQAKRGGRRVREAHLLWWSFLGGAPGVYLGMRVFCHKTQHAIFRYSLPLLMLCNLASAMGIAHFAGWA